jgi:hypothetical protein
MTFLEFLSDLSESLMFFFPSSLTEHFNLLLCSFSFFSQSEKAQEKEEDEEKEKEKEKEAEDDDEEDICEHSFMLRDDLGLVCKICGIIQKKIETIFDFQFKKVNLNSFWEIESIPSSRPIAMVQYFNCSVMTLLRCSACWPSSLMLYSLGLSHLLLVVYLQHIPPLLLFLLSFLLGPIYRVQDWLSGPTSICLFLLQIKYISIL